MKMTTIALGVVGAGVIFGATAIKPGPDSTSAVWFQENAGPERTVVRHEPADPGFISKRVESPKIFRLDKSETVVFDKNVAQGPPQMDGYPIGEPDNHTIEIRKGKNFGLVSRKN